MITNYAVIDHVGQVADVSAVYAKAYSIAIGYDKVYTLKKLCQIGSPYAREITDKMKWYNRYNKHPKKVYLICAFVDAKAEFVADAWRDRNIEVEFVTEEPEPTLGFESVSRARRCAMIWGSSLGWEFSAPLFRDEQRPESIDMYTPRHVSEDEALLSYGAKRFTKPESFINSFRAVASEEECKAFFEHYRWLYENNLLAESLEPDWELCPVCNRPHRISQDKCTWCDTEFESIECEAFYDDDTRHAKDELNFNSFDNYSSEDMAIKAYPRRKALINLFDEGCCFPDVKAYYI